VIKFSSEKNGEAVKIREWEEEEQEDTIVERIGKKKCVIV
jgi:hypothetical protein